MLQTQNQINMTANKIITTSKNRYYKTARVPKTHTIQYNASNHTIPPKSLYLDWSSTELELSVYVDELNTSTLKCLFDTLRQAWIRRENGTEVIIKWHYNSTNEEILRTGKDYSSLFEMPFDFIEISDKEIEY